MPWSHRPLGARLGFVDGVGGCLDVIHVSWAAGCRWISCGRRLWPRSASRLPAAIAQSASQPGVAKARILVHVTHGPEQPTRAALAFLVAKTALDEGHTVSLFLAGDAVQLIRDPVLDNLAGLGTGKLRELYDGIVKGGGRFYLSGMSSNAARRHRRRPEREARGVRPAHRARPVVPRARSDVHLLTYGAWISADLPAPA